MFWYWINFCWVFKSVWLLAIITLFSQMKRITDTEVRTLELTVALHCRGWLRALLMSWKIMLISLRKINARLKVCKIFSRRAERKKSVISLEMVAWVFRHMALSLTRAKNWYGCFKDILISFKHFRLPKSSTPSVLITAGFVILSPLS